VGPGTRVQRRHLEIVPLMYKLQTFGTPWLAFRPKSTLLKTNSLEAHFPDNVVRFSGGACRQSLCLGR
jgi:hypothetical protein